ncbi:MAG: hypothetical protein M3Q92_09860 [Actinomycetota bacterium]|nr:hypothetical protein [Actinomycetota bacterium]
MAAPTRSSNPGRPGRGSAIGSILLGLLSLATLPVAVALTQRRDDDLLDAAIAIPVAVVLGALAVWLSRRSRRRLQRAVATSSRGNVGRVGRLLGLGGLLLGVTAGLAIAVSVFLESVAD